MTPSKCTQQKSPANARLLKAEWTCLGSTETGFCGFLVSLLDRARVFQPLSGETSWCLSPCDPVGGGPSPIPLAGSVAGLVRSRRKVAERAVQAGVVEPADVLDDRDLELRAGAPHAICDQLGLERVDPRFRKRVVQRVAERTERLLDAEV